MLTQETKGMWLGFIGVLMFSLTLPFTRIAVAELSPYFVTFGRSLLGGICALLLFFITRPKLPTQAQWKRLVVIALGVVYGFPLFVAIASAAVGYSEGGKLSEEMGAVEVISWALVLTLPINLLLTYQFLDFDVHAVSTPAIASFM